MSILLVSIHEATGGPPPLMKVLWTCTIPCQSNDEPPRLLFPLQFAWCGSSILSPEMLDSLTPECQRRNHNRGARAVRVAHSEAVASCVTSGNTCEKQGPIRVAYGCLVLCDNEPYARRYSVCAFNAQQAWSAAAEVCSNPRMPLEVPGVAICDPNGQTPCMPPSANQ